MVFVHIVTKKGRLFNLILKREKGEDYEISFSFSLCPDDDPDGGIC